MDDWTVDEDASFGYYKLAFDAMNQQANRAWQFATVYLGTQLVLLAAFLSNIPSVRLVPWLDIALAAAGASYSMIMFLISLAMYRHAAHGRNALVRIEEASRGKFRIVHATGRTTGPPQTHLLIAAAACFLLAIWILITIFFLFVQ